VAKHNKFLGYYVTLAIVGANMVGTGVFTTLGLQAIDIQSGFAQLEF
jgi:basic amino acid/polyamine antiporter, APA family